MTIGPLIYLYLPTLEWFHFFFSLKKFTSISKEFKFFTKDQSVVNLFTWEWSIVFVELLYSPVSTLIRRVSQFFMWNTKPVEKHSIRGCGRTMHTWMWKETCNIGSRYLFWLWKKRYVLQIDKHHEYTPSLQNRSFKRNNIFFSFFF